MDAVGDLSKMKVADLKKHLKNKNLPITGNKNDLVERLQQALEKDENLPLDTTGGVDDDEFDEEEILGGEDVDIGKISQEEEAAALAGNLRVKDDALLIPEVQPEKKKISLKRSEPSLSFSAEADATSNENKETANSEETPNLNNDKENSLEPKHKIIKLSDATTENNLEARAKKFGTTTNTGTDSEETRKATRASRFGVANTNSSGNKRSKLSMEVGDTDVEKLKKRAERFGEVTSKSLSKLEEGEKIKQRQKRFTSTETDSEKKTEKTKEVDSEEAKTDEVKKAEISSEKNGTTKIPVTTLAENEDEAKQKRAQRFAAAE